MAKVFNGGGGGGESIGRDSTGIIQACMLRMDYLNFFAAMQCV